MKKYIIYFLVAGLLASNYAVADTDFGSKVATSTTVPSPYLNTDYLNVVRGTDHNKIYKLPLTSIGQIPLNNQQGTALASPGLTGQVWTGLDGNWTLGTSGGPQTGAGPLFQLSKTQQVPSAACSGNPLDVSCIAGLSVITTNTATDQMMVTSIYANASTNATNDAVAVFGIGNSLAGSTGIGTGAYFQGIAAATGTKGLGAEIRATNNTGSDTSYQSNGFSGTGALLLSGGGTNKPAEAIAITNGGGKAFTVGIGVKLGGASVNSYRDDANSIASLVIGANTAHTWGVSACADGSPCATFSSGFLEGPNNTPLLMGKNAAGNADIETVRVDSGNRVQLANQVNYLPGNAALSSCTGLGTGGSAGCAFNNNFMKSNNAGQILLTAGTSSLASSGSLSLTFSGSVSTSGQGICMAQFVTGSGTWNARANLWWGPGQDANHSVLNWDNNSANLTASAVYGINYQCVGTI